MRLLNRSAIAPAHKEKIKEGRNCNPVTIPRSLPLPVSCSTNQSCATRCAQLPILDIAFAKNKIRKLKCLNDLKDPPDFCCESALMVKPYAYLSVTELKLDFQIK